MADCPTWRRGTWLVIGLVLCAAVLVLVARAYRPPASQDVEGLLRQQGLPAARQTMALSLEGRKLLSLEEQRELDALYADALRQLSPQDRRYFQALAQKGLAMSDRDLTELNTLLQRALSALPQEKTARLWALSEKAVRLQHEHRKAATPQEPR